MHLLGACEKTVSAQQDFDGLHVWGKPGLSGYLVCLVQPNKQDKLNKPNKRDRPNEQDRLADFSNILLGFP